jgi:type II secretory pathway pseudopilin PulG
MRKERLINPESDKGMTLVEVLVAAGLFAFCVAGLLLTYMNLFILTDISRDSTLANNALQARLEEAKSISFGNLDSWAANNNTFNVVDSNFLSAGAPIVIGKGNITISSVNDPFTGSTYPDLKKVRVSISFKSRNRVIGEDKNLNGLLDAGEDDNHYANGAGQLNSPVEGVILIKNFTNSSS